jgi:hypothetical protein
LPIPSIALRDYWCARLAPSCQPRVCSALLGRRRAERWAGLSGGGRRRQMDCQWLAGISKLAEAPERLVVRSATRTTSARQTSTGSAKAVEPFKRA